MSDPNELCRLAIEVDRTDSIPLGEQIFISIRRTILDGTISSGGRLPSARDLAVQLGVARGTVRFAYDKLADESLVFSAGAAGTRVAQPIPMASAPDTKSSSAYFSQFTRPYVGNPLPFQSGVPAQDFFPAKIWAKMRSRALRADAHGHVLYADPRGDMPLRNELAAHLAISRQLHCHPEQIIITSGYRHGLLITLLALGVQGQTAWVENPGYPLGRQALKFVGLNAAPIDVDEEGLQISDGIRQAPQATVALVSPGQQAPMGVTMSARRRKELLSWAEAQSAWVIEDDYLGQLQIEGRAAPALASGEGAKRVIHIGSFSKTIGPTIGLGFIVVPQSLVQEFYDTATVLAPAPNKTSQLAIGEFISDGHYLRHLRHMKSIYSERREIALQHLKQLGLPLSQCGLSILVHLPDHIDDEAIASHGPTMGIAPAPLSPWYADAENCQRGLLLSITNLQANVVERAAKSLHALVTR